MSSYDYFASQYDRVVGQRSDVARYLLLLIKRYHPKAKTVLELGCGSGSMLKLLTKHYSCEGIDLSQEMLKIARDRAPKAILHRGDITDFDLARRFDVVVCPFDTINHVTSLRGWRSVFKNAHKHLNPGGTFIFDVNTEYKLESYSAEPFVTENTEDTVSIISVRRERRYRYQISLKRFVRRRGAGSFAGFEMTIPEIVVPTERILRDLAGYFTTVTMVDPDRRRPTEETEDLFFVCRGGGG
jgi:SAM-dependent methyltransferase